MDFRRGLFFVGLAALSLFLSSCDELRGPGGGQAHQRVQVSVSVRPEGSTAPVNGLSGSGTAQFGTSLVVLVAAGTPQLANQDALDPALVYDSALLDMTTSTVTLNIPLGVSVQLFEYTFNDVLTIDQIQADPAPVGGPPNVSDPFTVATETTVLTVNVPLTGTSFQETFAGALNPELWQETGAVTSSGGILKLSTSTVFDAAATDQQIRRGDVARIRSNRNILLNSHRVAGTIGVQSFSVTDSAVTSTPVRGRAQVRMHYQARDSRGDSTGLTIVRLLFHATPSGGYIVRMDGGTCTAPVCNGPTGSFVGFDAAHQKIIPIPLGFPTPNLPFSLEYIGGGRFRGTVNGSARTLDMSDLGTFDANDFREVELRAQSHLAFDAGDAADIRAFFTNIEVGDDGTAGNEGGPIRPVVPRFVYISNLFVANTTGYSINAATGFLTALGGSPFPSATDKLTATADPTSQFLYEPARAPNVILASSVDPGSGALAPSAGSPLTSATGPARMAITPDGLFAYVVHQTSANLRVFSRNPATGALAEISASPVATGVGPIWVDVHPTGRFVYVADLSGSRIFAFSRDIATGALTPEAGSPYVTAADPLVVRIHPGGDFLYVTHRSPNSVAGYRIDTSTGALAPVPGISFGTSTPPFGMAIAPNGKFLFVAAETGNINSFIIDTITGNLTLNQILPIGTQPQFLNIGPSGRFLVVAKGSTDQVAVLSVDASGIMTEVPGSPFANAGRPIDAAIVGYLQ